MNNYENINEIRKKLERMKEDIKAKQLSEYTKAIYNIDMVKGFVDFGDMANPMYRVLIAEQLKIMFDLVPDNEALNFIGEGHKKDATEFLNYPKHCLLNTPEAEFIEEFKPFLELPNTRIYRKNSINGMLNEQVRKDLEDMKNLKEIIFMGVCEDLWVMDFARTCARYLDEINRKVNMFVVANTVDTFDAPNHNREEWKKIARMVMEQAGITYVENYEELKERERVLKLTK